MQDYREKGQSLIEYALLLTLLVLVAVLGMSLMGVNTRQVYCSVVIAIDPKNPSCTASPTLCQDNFNSLANWANPGSQWGLANGQLCNSSASVLVNNCSQGAGIPGDDEVKIDIANLQAGNGYGVFFRTQSTNPMNGYIFQYDPGLGKMVFRKWVNGSELAPFASYTPPSGYNWLNTNRKVKLVIQGSTYKAYIDDQLVLTAVDSTYPKGGSALRTWDSTQACFDNFSMRPLQQ